VQGALVSLVVALRPPNYHVAEGSVPRFFSFFLLSWGAMLGGYSPGNLHPNWWCSGELTSLTSFLLIGYWHHRLDAAVRARMAFTVTAGAALCLLAGMLHGRAYRSAAMIWMQCCIPAIMIREHPLYHANLDLDRVGRG